MHTIIRATFIDKVLVLHTNSAYTLTMDFSNDIFPIPCLNWLKRNVGVENFKDPTLMIGQHFEALPSITQDLIQVTIN